jgi:hypothetical protein
MNSVAALNAKLSAQDNSELVEFWCLARFAPARRADHACDADALTLGVHTANELLNSFWRLAVSLDSGWRFDELRHSRKRGEVPGLYGLFQASLQRNFRLCRPCEASSGFGGKAAGFSLFLALLLGSYPKSIRYVFYTAARVHATGLCQTLCSRTNADCKKMAKCPWIDGIRIAGSFFLSGSDFCQSSVASTAIPLTSESCRREPRGAIGGQAHGLAT